MKLPLLLTNSYTRSRVWNNICAWFNPRQRWLTKVIPNTWTDKTELIPRLLFTCLIDFVESEEGLSQLNMDWEDELAQGHVTQEYIDDINKCYGLLKEVYDYVKTERDVLEKQQNAAYPELPPNLFSKGYVNTDHRSYGEMYGEVNRLEALIEQKDQWAMKAIVEQVGILWT